MDIIEKLLNVFIFLIIIAFIVVIGFLISNQIADTNTYINCCEGNVCSDTYYTPEDNLCHLVLCENSIRIINKSKCVYQGKNIALNLTNNDIR